MKTQIENSLLFLGNTDADYSQFCQLNIIIQNAIASKNFNELKSKMDVTITSLFDYGFGANHMWVKQKTSDDRILIITES